MFAKRNQQGWDVLMARFREQIVQIEDMAKQFIDASFKKLRSAEGAFDLLQNIKNIKSRESINTQLMSKWSEILDQYAREVDNIEEIFLKNKASPIVTKNQPRVAGAIAWSNSLFQRIKKTIIRFQSLQEMLASDQGRLVTKKYLTVARSMRAYEEQLYIQWCQGVEQNSLHYLKAHILTNQTRPTSNLGEAGMSLISAYRFAGAMSHRVVVNFKAELREIIKETKYLDKMGFMVPEAAMNVALQEAKYYSYEESLNSMLIGYSSVLGLLDPVEKKLLSGHINDLNRVMKPGFTRLNWNSLGIPEFIQRCNVEINKFSSIVNQIKKSAANIENVVTEISRTALIRIPQDGEILDAFVLFLLPCLTYNTGIL